MGDPATPRRDIVVIGASAGGMSVLMELAAALPAGIVATLLIVQHIGSHRSVLPELLQTSGPNPALHPQSGQRLEPGTLYIAPPDHHMLVVGDRILLNKEAKENHARPAIDPLFRSAAIAKGPRVIGVILSGRLDDGTAGLQAIKACGGIAVVQDPDDAEQPDMPASATDNVAVDHLVTRATLAATLLQLIGEPVWETKAAPEALACENQLSMREGNAMAHLDTIGKPSRITCPDCSGVLWQINDSKPPRYRCHTGHAYTQRSLEHTQSVRADEALWAALRALQERESLLREMAHDRRQQRDDGEAVRLEQEAGHVTAHALQLRQIVTEQAA